MPSPVNTVKAQRPKARKARTNKGQASRGKAKDEKQLKLVPASAPKTKKTKSNSGSSGSAALELATAPKNGASLEERLAASAEIVSDLSKFSAIGMKLALEMRSMNLVPSLLKTLNTSGKQTGHIRAAAVAIVTGLLNKFGAPVVPLLVPLLHPLLSLAGDKAREPKIAGAECCKLILEHSSEYSSRLLLAELLKRAKCWQADQTRFELILALCTKCPRATSFCLADAIEGVAEGVHDLKKKVSAAARVALNALCKLVQNEDVVPMLPILMSALENPSEVPKCVQTLASTTFVQTVDGPTLSIMTPILVRGFNARDVPTKRAAARIVENMVKLVEQPREVATTFLPVILPKLESARDNIPLEEARKVCGKAVDVLIAKSKPQNGGAILKGSADDMKVMILKALEGKDTLVKVDSEDANIYIELVSEFMSVFVDLSLWDKAVWTAAVMPYMTTFASESVATAAVSSVFDICEKENAGPEAEEEIDDGDEVLCDCEFSLAYGNKVLLRKTNLKLKRGHFYGLIGKNDSGKTSLMRAIADHRVDGFPEEDVLRTVFVETDIKVKFADLSVIDYIMERCRMSGITDVTRETMLETLATYGFNSDSPADVVTHVGQLSGGWRMKVALAHAMLLNADILLLDEPTNHLDSYNVKWVEDYLTSLDGVTCVMVSHDSGFLNRVCTDIIQIDTLRLKFYRGNLEAFVAKNPDAKAFFELKTEKFSFTFPQPARLKGINSKGKAIMKMKDISFTYPGAAKAQLNNVTIQVSLGSRVACVGINGAGKSTMIKLLTGELEPDEGSGEVWTHPNMLYGYIAQHAFHHIESHLEKTANQYICWRYGNGADREALNKITNKVNEEEAKQMAKPVTFNYKDLESGATIKKTGKIASLTQNRRENKLLKDQEYEVKLGEDTVTCWWIPREVLVKSGWEKALKQVDDRITIRESQFNNPLTKVNVKKHLENIGLEEEFSTHVPIGALSGGQKVKVVLGAALWNRPHVLILDEPTNYLDRDSLGALAAAIREFEGGVVMITHNSQFCDNLCPQVWHLEKNTLNVKGDAEWMNMEKFADEKKSKQATTTVDRFGNTVEVKKVAGELTNKERKKLIKKKQKILREAKKAGIHPDEVEFSDEEMYDL